MTKSEKTSTLTFSLYLEVCKVCTICTTRLWKWVEGYNFTLAALLLTFLVAGQDGELDPMYDHQESLISYVVRHRVPNTY
jgi:hypothetical protein